MRIATTMLDANVLTLWIVGCVSEEQVPRCKRTKRYTARDYRILVGYMDSFDQMATTPNVATEVSNLIGALHGEYLQVARQILSAGLQVWHEKYVPSSSAIANVHYQKLGLTDAALLSVAKHDTEIITDDFDLYSCLTASHVPVKNFTHLRAQQW